MCKRSFLNPIYMERVHTLTHKTVCGSAALSRVVCVCVLRANHFSRSPASPPAAPVPAYSLPDDSLKIGT